MGSRRQIYINSYNHVMNRGDKDEYIFVTDEMKKKYIELMNDKARRYGIDIYSYCIMDNHFHIILCDKTGNIDRFMNALESSYALFYRNRIGGKGFVFQGRYKSSPIEDEKYMKAAIVYVLLNPIRKRNCQNAFEYKWSSINEYFVKNESEIVNSIFVEEIFNNDFNTFEKAVLFAQFEKMPGEVKTKNGFIIGSKKFIRSISRRINTRKSNNKKKKLNRRKRDNIDKKTAYNVVQKWQKKYNININEFNTESRETMKMRNELLYLLREHVGLPYSEIIKYKPFRKLKHEYLYVLLARIKKRIKK